MVNRKWCEEPCKYDFTIQRVCEICRFIEWIKQDGNRIPEKLEGYSKNILKKLNKRIYCQKFMSDRELELWEQEQEEYEETESEEYWEELESASSDSELESASSDSDIETLEEI